MRISYTLFGCLIGVLFGIIFANIEAKAFVDYLEQHFYFVLFSFLVLLLISLVAFIFHSNLTRLIFGVAAKDTSALIENFSCGVAELSSGKLDQLPKRSVDLTKEAFGLYSSWAFRAWIFRSVIGLVVIMAGSLGTYVLIEQNRLIGLQLVAIGQQTTQIKEQNSRFDVQNEIAGLSLVSVLRTRLKSRGIVKSDAAKYDTVFRKCELKSEVFDMRQTSNESEISAVRQLSENESIGLKVREALVHLLVDEDPAVRWSAGLILDGLGHSFDNPIIIDGLYNHEPFFLKNQMSIEFFHSKISEFICTNCTVDLNYTIFSGFPRQIDAMVGSVLDIDNVDEDDGRPSESTRFKKNGISQYSVIMSGNEDFLENFRENANNKGSKLINMGTTPTTLVSNDKNGDVCTILSQMTEGSRFISNE